jgi:hypothetical protein
MKAKVDLSDHVRLGRIRNDRYARPDTRHSPDVTGQYRGHRPYPQ